MAYFLRYTENPEIDLKYNTSYHQNDCNEDVKLDGLCAFELEAETLEEAIEEAKDHEFSYVYSFDTMGDIAHIFEGEFVDYEEEGVLINATKYHKIN